MPRHGDLVTVLELLQGEFEMAATQVAEGAVEIGPDIDVHR